MRLRSLLTRGLLVLLLGCQHDRVMAQTPEALNAELIEATKAGVLTEVETLLAAGIDPDTVDAVNNTALIFASRDGHLAIAEALIAAGATVDWVDDEGVTPLILAAFKNHPALVDLLLAHGADQSVRDQWGRTARDYALRRGAADPILHKLDAAR